jgi:hypothetical protein
MILRCKRDFSIKFVICLVFGNIYFMMFICVFAFLFIGYMIILHPEGPGTGELQGFQRVATC